MDSHDNMSKTLWITGLSASGKSTLARGVAKSLQASGLACKIVDGDELRHGLCAGLGYSRADRHENIRRAAEVCRILNAAGVIAITALISPYREDREMAHRIVGAGAFLEIWLSAPLDACEQRDPKGLYRQARAGKIEGFTGIDDPYEPPISPHLELETHRIDVPDSVARIEALLRSCEKFPAAASANAKGS